MRKIEYIKIMNKVINYIEENILYNINYEKISQIACCPNYHFQKMFSFMMNISISKYIRYRRLTLAAIELQENKNSIIEISQKYGYKSQAAFSRAFKNLHGVSPMMATKKGVTLKFYPKAQFNKDIKQNRKFNYRIEDINSFTISGFEYKINTNNSVNEIINVWNEAKLNGKSDKILKVLENNEYRFLNGIIGVFLNGEWGEKREFSYILGTETKKKLWDKYIEFPKSQWVVFETNKVLENIDAWESLYLEWLPVASYKLENLPAIECYYDSGHIPQNEIWIPIKKIN